MFAILQTQRKSSQLLFKLALSTVFFFLCANFKLYLPASPVPVTFHTFAVMVLGLMLPFRLAIIPFGIYMVEGLIGSPIFGLPLSITGLSMGYFVGMLASLYFLDVFKSKLPLSVLLTLSNVIILAFGVMYLQSVFSLNTALKIGLLPYIAGDVFKAALAYAFLKKYKQTA